MVSTPNAPGGLFERIEKDQNSKYKKLLLDYTYGLGKIYDPEYIKKKQLEPEFEREYNLKYLGLVGNVFHIKDIENAIKEYDIESEDNNHYAVRSVVSKWYTKVGPLKKDNKCISKPLNRCLYHHSLVSI